MTNNTSSRFFAFLFDPDHAFFQRPRVYNYGTPCEDAFLRSLAASDESRAFCARVRRGDVLARNLASRTNRLIKSPAADSTGKSSSSSRHCVTDPHALAVVTGDLANSLTNGWRSLELAELPVHLAARNVYCLSVFPVDLSLVARIDATLKAYPPYIGAIELDAGNPIHVEVFFRKLLDCVYFENGNMKVSRWDTDEGVYQFGSEPEKYFTLSELSHTIFRQTAPPFPSNITPSARGELSAHRHAEATKESHFERVAHQLMDPTVHADGRYAIDLNIVLPDDEQLDIPVQKLLGYSLNPNHESGKNKAKVFSETLGIEKRHWRYLAYQLVNGLAKTTIERVRATEHGLQHSALVQILGINQISRTVVTAWIIRKEGPAQLVTAYVADRSQQRHEAAPPPPWVPEELEGPERWRAIYEIACRTAQQAADACIPTPMHIAGFEVELEGLCGNASVRLDGRTRFARWLVSQHYAQKRYGGGVTVPAQVSSQSFDRAVAYAKSFARVLWLNGIDGATVEKHLS